MKCRSMQLYESQISWAINMKICSVNLTNIELNSSSESETQTKESSLLHDNRAWHLGFKESSKGRNNKWVEIGDWALPNLFSCRPCAEPCSYGGVRVGGQRDRTTLNSFKAFNQSAAGWWDCKSVARWIFVLLSFVCVCVCSFQSSRFHSPVANCKLIHPHLPPLTPF